MNICKNCQSENEDGAKFCGKCGAELPAAEKPDATTKPERRAGKKRVILIAVLALVVLLVAAAAVWYFTQPEESDTASVIAQEGSFVVLTQKVGIVDEISTLMHNGKTVIKNVQYESCETSLDGNSVAFVADDSLWYCDANGLLEVTKDAVEHYDIAALGGALIYQTEDGLYLYDAVKKDNVKVADHMADCPMISGSGSYVAYYKDHLLFRFDGTKTEALGENGSKALSSIGDDGTVITATHFFNAKGDKFDVGFPTLINADGTQRLLYENENNELCCIVDGNIKILDGVRNLTWVPYKARDVRALSYSHRYDVPQHLKTLTDQFYYSSARPDFGGGLFYLNEAMKLEKVDLVTEGDPNLLQFSTSYVPGDRYVYFLETYGLSLPAEEFNEEYCTLHRVDRQTLECKTISENVYWMEAAADGIAYYLTVDKELYRYDGETNECLLQNVDCGGVGYFVSENGTALVRDLGGNLYSVQKNSQPMKIAEETVWVRRDGNWFYYKDKAGVAYISSDGVRFDELGDADISFGNYY